MDPFLLKSSQSGSRCVEGEYHVCGLHDDTQAIMLGIISNQPPIYDIPSDDRRNVYHLRVIRHNIHAQFVRIERDLVLAKHQERALLKAMHDSTQTTALIVTHKLIKGNSEPPGITRH